MLKIFGLIKDKKIREEKTIVLITNAVLFNKYVHLNIKAVNLLLHIIAEQLFAIFLLLVIAIVSHCCVSQDFILVLKRLKVLDRRRHQRTKITAIAFAGRAMGW